MRAHTAGLLVIAAFAQSTLGALPWGILRRASDHLPPNATAVTPSAGDATRYVTVSLITQVSSSSLASLSYPVVQSSLRTNSTGSHNEVAGSGPSPETKSDTATSNLHLIKSSTARSSSIPVESESSSRRVSAANRVQRPPPTPASVTIAAANSTTNPPGSATPPPHHPSTSASLTFWNTTQAPNRTVTSTSTDDSKTCTELTGDEPVTEYSIVYTATITLSGNYSNYTPPYPTIETPTYCGIDVTLSTGPFFTTIALGSGGFIISTKQPAATCSGSSDDDCNNAGGSNAADSSYRGKIIPSASSSRATVTFVTTEKNPATVTASEAPPGFGVSGSVGFSVQQHQSAASGNEGGSNGGSQSSGVSRGSGGRVDSPQSQQKETSLPVFTVTARADNVVINDKTFSSLKPDQTTTVTVSQGTFTILPTVVVGEGATVQKPQPIGTAVSVLTPVTGSAGGLLVIVSGSEAVVDGTTFEIPPLGTTTTIHDELITAGPGQIAVNDQTVTFKAAGGPQSDVIVTGAEMVTAVGQSIFIYQSTTLTYGPGIPEATKVLDDDTVTVGPSGVVIRGTTLGGTTAKTSSTRYEIVGGATITKLSPSYVVIDGTTFTAGPKGKTTTKVIGGETITIGPKGVSISTMTLSLPFGSSTITTIKASATKTASLPSETAGSKSNQGGGDDNSNGDNNAADEDNKGSVLKPSLVVGITGLCLAIGVWVWL